jgi:hemoglobin-like flavoprotein
VNPDILRSTWREAIGHGDPFVQWFYARLFLAHPELRPLFGTTMEEQRAKIAATLDLVVEGADNIEAVVPRLRKLGRMHRRFQVTPDMFPAVGDALLATFARFLEDRWTAEAADTWAAAFRLVAGVMIDAYTEAVRIGGPACWDALILETTRTDGTLRIRVDAEGFPWDAADHGPVRVADQPGGWRTLPLDAVRHEIVVPVTARPVPILDLLSASPGDHLWLAHPLDIVDQEVTA